MNELKDVDTETQARSLTQDVQHQHVDSKLWYFF